MISCVSSWRTRSNGGALLSDESAASNGSTRSPAPSTRSGAAPAGAR